MSAPAPLVVSIDWDFFPWNGSSGPVQTPTGDVRGRTLFVPEHRERVRPRPLQRRWRLAERLFRLHGLEVEQEWTIRPDRGSVAWERFLDELRLSVDLAAAPLWYADSHAHGLFAVREAVARTGRAATILHFDAHADLGYRSRLGTAVARERRRGRTTCASWLYHAIDRGLAESATVIYPDWRGLEEWERVRQFPHVRACGARVRATTWSEWLEAVPEHRSVAVMVNLARSSAYAPPWLDTEFERLLASLPALERRCLDCSPIARVGHQDACRPREWPTLPKRTHRRAPMHASFASREHT